MANSGPLNPNPVPNSDRLEQLKQFDESKIGVKGLVDKGLTTIPSFFIHSEESNPEPKTRSSNNHCIPVVDFSASRETVVEQVHRASTSLGFFQIINHSVPVSAINRIVGSIKSFNEQNNELKMKYYSRDITHGAAYSTNFDLYNSKAASWRDTLQVRLSPTPPDWEYVPEVCREAVMEWDKEVVKIGEELMGLLCEGLGVEKDRLKELSCLDGRVMAAHYYPYCPQPELTKGLTPHTDPGVLTVLVQNEMSGLQVKFGEDWVDLKPIPGAIVINIGDILQIISNDEYKSVVHRVLANPFQEPRVSVAIFFNPGQRENSFGPLPELISDEKPAVYREFMYTDYMGRFFSKELDGKTLTNYYRVSNQI
ncbi:1-aminocyclopropane-1-carboxylate oxidase homolog 4 [Solanum lycopersicum]|uniref:Fe2OG dioxygenase domain-containing protein n=1 Tax=Solanum lycopersicum TaxID=4081 RepID=A0A3Q7FZA2_SOLLC|nr:1-aminocyclopropane-1-carboxylate oxidase homolog 4 [Solanum lycopersicum]